MEKINISQINYNVADPFSLEDLAEFIERGKPQSGYWGSLKFHYDYICQNHEIYGALSLDENNNLIDGMHRIAAVALYNQFCDESDKITEVFLK